MNGARLKNVIALAETLLGGGDLVRDELQALPEQYEAWKEGASAPEHVWQRLVAIVVAAQARRVKEHRELLNALSRPR